MPFEFSSAEDWQARMRLIQEDYALDQPLVILLGSGLSLDRAKKRGVADVATLVAWIRADGIQFAATQSQNEYQAAMEALKRARGARGVSALIRKGILHAYQGQGRLREDAMGAPSEEQREACRLLEQQPDWELPRGVLGLAAYLRAIVDGRKTKPNPKIGAIQVVTTNFDPLVEVACKRLGLDVVPHSISQDARPSMSACAVQIWHVHGSWWDVTLHSPEALNQHRTVLKQTLQQWMNDAQICILGYGGWQDLVSTSIAETFSLFGGNGDVLWSFYETDEQQIRDKYREPLERLASARALSQVTLFRGVDLHAWGEVVPSVPGLPLATATIPTAAGAVPSALLLRLHDTSQALLAVAPLAAKAKLTRLLTSGGRLPLLGTVLGEICYVLSTIAEREPKRLFACSALDAISALSACILVMAPRDPSQGSEEEPITVESCLVAELFVAADHERPLRLWQSERGAAPVDGFDEPLLEEGPAEADWILALERDFWTMKDPNQDYDPPRHKDDLQGFLEAKKYRHEECFATVDGKAPLAALSKAIPHARFFVRSSAGALSPGINERTLAELLKTLLDRAPDLCADTAAKKATFI